MKKDKDVEDSLLKIIEGLDTLTQIIAVLNFKIDKLSKNNLSLLEKLPEDKFFKC